MSGLAPHFRMMAGYNAWANRRLYDAASRLSEAEYKADRGAFFRSLHGTLNHLLVTDRIWMMRFTGAGEAADRLDTLPFDDLIGLRSAREAEDATIVGFVAGLSEDDLAGVIRYRRVSTPDEYVQPLAPALSHLFNHQTHHRGQAHCILTGLDQDAPPLDLLFFQRETGTGMA